MVDWKKLARQFEEEFNQKQIEEIFAYIGCGCSIDYAIQRVIEKED